MKKRTNKKLTFKQAKIISFSATIIFSVFMAIMFIIAGIENSLLQPLWLCFLAYGVLVIFFACAMWAFMQIYSDPKSDLKEKNKAFGFLNKDTFTELYFIPQNNSGSEYEMLLTIIKRVECKFFAKLKEDDEIILIAKDKEDNEIYRCEISNYSYFNERFKLKAN